MQLIAFVLYNLCRYPEYIQPLRDEIQTLPEGQPNNSNDEMPYLDSFLKETARLNPLTDSKD
jgi:cytochrome P450